jgi:hypothetical protein
MPRLSAKIHRKTGRTLNIRYKEHTHDIRGNNSNSGYSNHILRRGHTFRTIRETTDSVKTGKKGKYLNTLQKYHFYEISNDNLHTL